MVNYSIERQGTVDDLSHSPLPLEIISLLSSKKGMGWGEREFVDEYYRNVSTLPN
jgi:hypothetical protein